MRVAMLSDCFLPRLGGIEVQVHDLAVRLAERGHDVEVFTATAGADGLRGGAVEIVDGLRVHRLAIPLPAGLPVNPFAVPALRERLVGFDVGHIHMGVVSPFAVDCARVTASLGLPTAMTWHCMLDRMAPVVRALGAVRRWSAGGAAISAVSAVAAEPLARIVAPAPVTVLPNGIDAQYWRPQPEARADDGVVRVVTAMRLAARKRGLPLLQAIARARAVVPAGIGLELTILGEGPQRARLERFVAEHDLAGWVHLPGRVPRESLRLRYAAADLFVSPTVLESFGIAALEARSVGLPIVGRVGSGIGEFVSDGVNGLLAADDEQFAAAIATLVTDRAMRERMRVFNETNPPAQDWTSVLDSAESEYRRAIADTARAAR